MIEKRPKAAFAFAQGRFRRTTVPYRSEQNDNQRHLQADCDSTGNQPFGISLQRLLRPVDDDRFRRQAMICDTESGQLYIVEHKDIRTFVRDLDLCNRNAT